MIKSREEYTQQIINYKLPADKGRTFEVNLQFIKNAFTGELNVTIEGNGVRNIDLLYVLPHHTGKVIETIDFYLEALNEIREIFIEEWDKQTEGGQRAEWVDKTYTPYWKHTTKLKEQNHEQ